MHTLHQPCWVKWRYHLLKLHEAGGSFSRSQFRPAEKLGGASSGLLSLAQPCSPHRRLYLPATPAPPLCWFKLLTESSFFFFFCKDFTTLTSPPFSQHCPSPPPKPCLVVCLPADVLAYLLDLGRMPFFLIFLACLISALVVRYFSMSWKLL